MPPHFCAILGAFRQDQFIYSILQGCTKKVNRSNSFFVKKTKSTETGHAVFHRLSAIFRVDPTSRRKHLQDSAAKAHFLRMDRSHTKKRTAIPSAFYKV